MKIHRIYQPKRKKPYVARWYEQRRQRNRFFASEEARADFIEQFHKLSDRQDPTLQELALHQLIRWQQAMAIDPDADPVEVFRFWQNTHRYQHLYICHYKSQR
jgi:hypothetical protein